MMKTKLLIITTVTGLGGCVSNSDLQALQTQVNQVNAQLTTLQSQVQTLQQELTVVKGQRVVRLPTGAPTATRERQLPSNPAMLSEEQRLFDAALADYKGGNVQAAIRQFEQVASRYPDSKPYAEALYYLGEANYTLRDYQRAQYALELLVYQTPNQQIDPKAIDLLEKIYRTRGDDAKLKELMGFKQQLL